MKTLIRKVHPETGGNCKMDLNMMFRHEIIIWVVLPILIFLAGLVYVSLGTLRIIFIARGRRILSPLLGFFEVSVWLVAIGQIMSNVSNIAAYVAYAAGYAFGNYVGILMEEKMALGILAVRIIVTSNEDILMKNLAEAGFGVTTVDGKGSKGGVKIIYTIVQRKHLEQVSKIIEESHSNAFYSIEDARSVAQGVSLKRPRSD